MVMETLTVQISPYSLGRSYQGMEMEITTANTTSTGMAS